MSVDQIDLDCLLKAQQGDEESRSLLAQQAKGKVYTFIYRTALDSPKVIFVICVGSILTIEFTSMLVN